MKVNSPLSQTYFLIYALSTHWDFGFRPIPWRWTVNTISSSVSLGLLSTRKSSHSEELFRGRNIEYKFFWVRWLFKAEGQHFSLKVTVIFLISWWSICCRGREETACLSKKEPVILGYLCTLNLELSWRCISPHHSLWHPQQRDADFKLQEHKVSTHFLLGS